MAQESSASTHHPPATINREEMKLKMLLTGSYDYVHRETGKMIQKKLYKKAFQLLEKFNQSRKDLEIGESVQLNRRIFHCINKILKQNLMKPELEWDSEEILENILLRGQQAFLQVYKYLNIFVFKVLPNEANHIVLKDVSHLSQEETISQPKIRTLSMKNTIYQQNFQVNKDDNESDSSKIAEMINKSQKPLNVQFELDQLWYNACELLLKSAIIYKNSGKVKITYFNLKEADRIAETIIVTSNPELINLCARVKISLANFYLELREYGRALEESNKALVILIGEMAIRMNQEKFVGKHKQNKIKRRQKKCAKTVLSALITQIVTYESQGEFHRMMEALTTANWFSEKFVPGIDEFKKYVMKISLEGKNRLEKYLHDTSDLSFISQYALEMEIQAVQKFKRDHQVQNNTKKLLKKFNDEMYNLFQFKQLNKEQYFLYRGYQQQQQQESKKKEKIIHPFSEHQKQQQDSQVHLGTDISLNILESNSNSEDSLFDASFFAPSIDNFMFDPALYEQEQKQQQPIQKKTLTNRKSPTLQHRKLVNQNKANKANKPVGLIKIGVERPIDHKSKILTTSQCIIIFLRFSFSLLLDFFNENKSVEEKDLRLEKKQKFQKMLENLDYRRQPGETNYKQDLDMYVNRIVNNKIGDGGFNEYNKIQKELIKQNKQEDFDKKEFGFCLSMLKQKNNEALLKYKQRLNKRPVNIEIDTKIENQANVFFNTIHLYIFQIIYSKINMEKDIKELKKRKIDNLVAAKKIKQADATITLKDPEETSYLKKALEKNKKKQLKDLILKHKDALGLRRFYSHTMREQKEMKKQEKLKQKQQMIEQILEEKPPENQEKKQVRIEEKNSKIDNEKQVQKQQQQNQQQQQQNINKSILKNKQKIVEQDEDLQGTQILIQQAQIQQERIKKKEEIGKNQKKARQVISLIIDDVEKKLDLEGKSLEKMIINKQGLSNSKYIDEDEKTYVKFVDTNTDLFRSAHLLKVKNYPKIRELGEKQFSFVDLAQMQYQIQRKSVGNLGSDKSDNYYCRIGHINK